MDAPREHRAFMSLLHKLEIRTDVIYSSRTLGETPGPSLARPLKHPLAIPPRCVRGVVVIGISLILFHHCQPALAQAVHLGTVHTTALPGPQPDALRPGSRNTDPSALETATGRPAAALPPSLAGTISGTVLDVNGDMVPGATVVLKTASPDDQREVTSDDTAAFKFDSVKPGIPYEVSIHLKGFSDWTSSSIVLEPSQFFFLSDIHLKIEVETESITVYGSTDQIAVEQVRLEEQQRVLGFIPNFYVVYDSANAVPLTTKLKFNLAMKVATDPVTIMGVGFMSGIDQAANTPNYVQGAKGFGQRFGANAAGEFSDILIGGAILPSLLHQDPRYFYQGTGGTRSRLVHALIAPFVCRGDNGRRQINFSSMGGNMGATALSMAYYPDSNRGAGTVFGTFGISTAERVISAIAQEFILPRFTSSLKGRSK